MARGVWSRLSFRGVLCFKPVDTSSPSGAVRNQHKTKIALSTRVTRRPFFTLTRYFLLALAAAGGGGGGVIGPRPAQAQEAAAAGVAPVVSQQALMLAFSEVFGVRDVVLDAGSPLMECALRQLDQMGIPRGVVLDPAAIDSASAAAHRNASYAYAELMRRGLGSQGDRVLAGLLMRAALGNIVLGLRDPSDWSLVMLDPTTGDLVRRRSFSSTRLAVIETLLLICIVALGRMVWVYKI